ncbi:threonine/serine dehydratase [Actinopolymorpha alba]|uniref:threonine/serine dehydratase n=1 Tax=Actinopolymorpha alba TaxID=533267 RepID=UPI000378103E|nr:threonine/serine dehydratase [Actinopolymorpha alba]
MNATDPVVLPSATDLYTAAARVGGIVRRTPVYEIDGQEFGVAGARVIVKLELLQHTGSFKVRGALNTLLAGPVPSDGVVAASGGNHGAAVAWAAARVGVPARIFVPSTSPPVKAARVASYGAEVVVVDGYYPDAWVASQKWAEGRAVAQIHAYDAPEVVAGQSTLGLELAEQVPEASTVLVSCGGGGLFAGVTLAMGETLPDSRVVPVEPERCPTLHTALVAGSPVQAEVGGVAADSMGAAAAGRIAHAVASQHGVQPVLVPDDAIVAARTFLWERCRILAEPGGATAFAALHSGAFRPEPGETVVVVISGANTTELPGS